MLEDRNLLSAVLSYPAFTPPAGPNLLLNGVATIQNSNLRLVSNALFQAGSAYYFNQVDISRFDTTFGFQLTNPTNDGFTFTIQNQSGAALGNVGTDLGYGGIVPSVAVKFDLYDNVGEGGNSTGLYTKGATPDLPSIDLTPTGVNLHSGDVFQAHFQYDGSTLTWTITDTQTGAFAVNSRAIDIPSTVLSKLAWVGFTAATGGFLIHSPVQNILSWGYSNQLNTTTALLSSVNPAVYGQAVTFTATVSGYGGAPTGTLTFMDGATTLGTATLVGGSATYVTSALAVGSHTITAVYGGDGNFNGSTSANLTQTVNQATTTTALVSSVNPSLYGQSTTFMATVTAVAPGVGTPTGTVTFMDGATILGTGTLSGGSARYVTSALAVGTHGITAAYGGDANYTGSTSTSATQTVNQASTATTLTSSGTGASVKQIDFSGGFAGASSLALNGSAIVSGSALQLTDGVAFNQAGSAFYSTRVDVSSFTTQFTFQTTAGSNTADGFTFTIQNSGPTALGLSGGDLGYGQDWTGAGGIANSIAIKFDLFNNQGEGPNSTGLYKNGVAPMNVGSIDLTGTGIDLHNGDVFQANMTYDGARLLVTLTDTVTGAQATQSYTVNIPGIVNSTTAYAGFTGGDGAVLSLQRILNWTYDSAPLAATSTYGQAVTFTATVKPLTPGAGTRTGTVTFKDGTTTLGTGTLSGGIATYTTSALAVGNHAITAVYNGDSNFTASTSGSFTQTVNPSSTSTTLTSSGNPTLYDQVASFTASVSAIAPGAGTPTGTVTFKDGPTALGTDTLSGGIATYATSALTAGNHTITAVYNGDSNFTTSTSGTFTQTVNQSSASTTLASSVNPTSYGQLVTFTATVSALPPSGGTPTGTVTFNDGAIAVGTGALSGGIATYVTSALAVGNHTITAVYGGDTNFINSASGTLTQTIKQASSNTTLTSSANPSVVGLPVTFTATVTAVGPGSGTPTGAVTFKDGSTTLAIGALSGSTATYTMSALVVGSHSLTAVYSGDTKFMASTSANLTEIVNRASAAIAVDCSVRTPMYGQVVTFSATVSVLPPGAGVPNGTVTFQDGIIILGSALLTNGVATFSTSSLAAGVHVIWAVYNGSSNFNGSSALGYNEVVTPAGTAVAITSSVAGLAVTFTVTVHALAPSSSTPTGTITLLDGSAVLWTGTLVGGTAVFSTTALLAGSHSITAIYAGQSNFNSAAEHMSLTINSPDTGSNLTSSVSPFAIQQLVLPTSTLSAPVQRVVSPANGGPPSSDTAFASGYLRRRAADDSADQRSGSATNELNTSTNQPLSTDPVGNSTTAEPKQSPVDSRRSVAVLPIRSTSPLSDLGRITEAAFQVPEQRPPFRPESLRAELDALGQQLDGYGAFHFGDAVVEFGLTAAAIGYVAWNFKNSYWIASALTSTPLWKQAFSDPLAVLDFWEEYSKLWGTGCAWDEDEEKELKPVLG